MDTCLFVPKERKDLRKTFRTGSASHLLVPVWEKQERVFDVVGWEFEARRGVLESRSAAFEGQFVAVSLFVGEEVGQTKFALSSRKVHNFAEIVFGNGALVEHHLRVFVKRV